jgi:4-hydroxy-tetrahydrodipicolinate reductase
MGQRLVALTSADNELELVAALESAEHPAIGKDAGTLAGVGQLGIPLTSKLEGDVDAVIDFSVPAAAIGICLQCAEQEIPLVLATTGLDDDQQLHVLNASQKVAICQSPNMSLAVNLLMKLAETAGRALKDHPSGADVEILERHHRFKEDSPSGTALEFGRRIAEAMDLTESRHGREGRPGPRPHNEIGYHAIRTGDNPGEHTIVFGMLGESIELRVAATNRDCYAHGALVAAQWLVGKPPGIHTMSDVLGLSDGEVRRRIPVRSMRPRRG